MERKLGKGIVIVFIANIINLCFSLATNFLLPKYLSVNSYAAIKTYQLYASYAGLLHLGYVDSIFLKYGGKDLKSREDSSFFTTLSTMRIFQVVITTLICIVAYIVNDSLLLMFALSILPLNMHAYYKFLYQATGEFKLYGRIMNSITITTFIINMVVLFVFKSDNYSLYIILYILLFYIIWFYFEIDFKLKHKIEKGQLFSVHELTSNIKDGILLTIGNLASTFLTSMDRWFVKFLLTTIDFAQYSFAVSVESILNVAITPVTTTLYNYFCRNNDKNTHQKVFKYVLIFSTFLPSAAFPAKFILEKYLNKYFDASFIIFILFAAQMFYIVIKSVFVNLYKVEKKQGVYFWKLIVILFFGFIFNTLGYFLFHNNIGFAIGTLLSAIVWFFISLSDFKYLELTIRTYIYYFGEMLIFLLLGFFFSAITGFIIYFFVSFVMLFVFMNSDFYGLLYLIMRVLRIKQKNNAKL